MRIKIILLFVLVMSFSYSSFIFYYWDDKNYVDTVLSKWRDVDYLVIQDYNFELFKQWPGKKICYLSVWEFDWTKEDLKKLHLEKAVVWYNKEWNSFIMDMGDKKWRKYLKKRLKYLKKLWCDGVFLDTLWQQWQDDKAKWLVKYLRSKWKKWIFIVNNAHNIKFDIVKYVDWYLFENFWDKWTKYCDDDCKWYLSQFKDYKRIKEKYRKLLWAISYWDPDRDKNWYNQVIDIANKYWFEVDFGNYDLTKIYKIFLRNNNISNKINNKKNNVIEKGKLISPYNFSKFRKFLDYSKLTYPTSKDKVVNYWKFKWFVSEYFYATQNGDLVFVLKKEKNNSKKIRNELRWSLTKRDDGFNLASNDIYHLKAEIKLMPILNMDEYTFLQIHSEKHPILRVVVKKQKNWKQNHIWAVYRITTADTWKRTKRFDLGKVEDRYVRFDIYAWGGKLKVLKDWKVYLDEDVSWWPEKKNYFKAGIYDSRNSKWPWVVKVYFKDLTYEKLEENKKVHSIKSSKEVSKKENNNDLNNKNRLNLTDKFSKIKEKIDEFFDEIVEKYGDDQEGLDKIMTKIIMVVNTFLRIDVYKHNDQIRKILLYIKNKANSFIK